MLGKAESWVETVTSLTEASQGGLIQSASAFATVFTNSSFFKNKFDGLKSKYIEKTFYLYLVDEFTGQPVYDFDGVYPIPLDVKSDYFEKQLPLMRLVSIHVTEILLNFAIMV